MKKLAPIIMSDLVQYQQNHWTLYSSQHYNHSLRRLWFNGISSYKVTNDLDILYEGNRIGMAIHAYNNPQ
jgi:hypothetical protein